MISLIRGNALDLPLADQSVDLIVTSPPYFSLRSYSDNGEHYEGQLGSEATPGEFLDALIAATREMVRVLKPSGSIFLNLGDKYAGSRMDGSSGNGTGALRNSVTYAVNNYGNQGRPQQSSSGGIPTKSLMGLPWRYAIRCIDELGLILRAEIIWQKLNGLPESVGDRVRRSHEQWFHFTKEPRYYTAVDEIREPHVRQWGGAPNGGNTYATMKAPGTKDANLPNALPNQLGKLPGSVWEIPTQPLNVPAHIQHARCCAGVKRDDCEDGVDHFAAFPFEIVRRIIRGWSPSGICTECGEGRRPVARVTRQGDCTVRRDSDRGFGVAQGVNRNPGAFTITSYACACPEPTAPTRPAIVVDPFGGTGTTSLVADALGRHGISFDLSFDYCRLAQWRTTDPGERAKAMQVEKPAPAPDDMDSLLDLIPTQAAHEGSEVA